MKRLLPGLLCLAIAPRAHGAPPAHAAPPAAAETVPSVYVIALPAAVSLVAWLPVKKAPDEVDLDLRVEVVLPSDCGDQLAGLLRRGDREHERYDVVVARHPVGECKQDASRIGRREAIRMRLPVAGTGVLRLGALEHKLARTDQGVTLDGQGPTGDAPGAPPTARPSALVLGEVVQASPPSTRRLAEPGALLVTLGGTVRWPSCVDKPLGALGSGMASSHFRLTQFEPIARMPLDESCAGTVVRPTSVPTVVRAPIKGPRPSIAFGKQSVDLPEPQPAAR